MAFMGYRTGNAYDQAQREEWRRFMAAQPPLRRLYIRAWNWLIALALINALIIMPLIAFIRIKS